MAKRENASAGFLRPMQTSHRSYIVKLLASAETKDIKISAPGFKSASIERIEANWDNEFSAGPDELDVWSIYPGLDV